MARAAGPPAYAWDWFSRQRLLWREAQRRLAHHTQATAPRYAGADSKSDVIALLRSDYVRDDDVRGTVDAVVRALVFLDRTDVPFARLGIRTPPRGMRWWWTALTGEDVEVPGRARVGVPVAATQLSLDEVHEGYGG